MLQVQKITRRFYSSNAATAPFLTQLFPNEPTKPNVVTALPGPKAIAANEIMSSRQESRTVVITTDLENSIGNYVCDADGNYLLDLNCSIASLSLGYNNPVMLEKAMSKEWATYLVNRPAIGVAPPASWGNLVNESIMSVAPKGLDMVFTAMCGTCANESAYKATFMNYQQKHKRHGNAEEPFTEEEMTSCMKNQSPGTPDLAIMSFEGAFHGRLFGSLTTTRSKSLHKVDIPAFKWPGAPFPQLRYPLEENEKFNQEEEERCLAEVCRIMKEWPIPVAGLIVEPIQAEGGDNHASPQFFQQLQQVCKDNGVTFIVDEVQTGVGATGTFWAHEAWNLPRPPDIVSFAKKMQISGFYFAKELQPNQAYRNFNTWLGDPVRALQAKEIIKEIKTHNLLENVRKSGAYLKSGLQKLSKKYGIIHNVRGQGTFIAFDFSDAATRDSWLSEMRRRGVHMIGCGTRTVRLRPMLIFTEKHARVALEIMEDTWE